MTLWGLGCCYGNMRTWARNYTASLKLRKTPISPRIILIPRVPDQILVDRPHICETIGNLRTIRDNHLGRSGKVWRNRLSPTRVEYRKSDQLLFFNMFKNSSRSKPVGPRSSEDPLKAAFARLPSGALYTLWSSLLPSGAFVYPLRLSAEDLAKGVTKNR